MFLKRLYPLLLILFLGVATQIVSAQNPIYYTIGENELNEADIYSVLETKKGDVYISSNKGLFKYSNGLFFKFPKNKDQKGNSLFSLVKTTSGTIFCSNLEGQVFKIENNQLVLFYTVPQKYIPHYLYLLADKHDHLIIVSKQINVLTTDGKNLDVIHDYRFIDTNINGQIVVGDSDKSYYLLAKKYKKYQLPFKLGSNPFFYQKSIQIQNLIGENTKKFHFKMNNNISIDETSNSILRLNATTYLARLRTYGVEEVKLKNDTITKGNTFFNGTFISSFTQGESGTLYLGTFKQGLLVVPNYNFKTVKTATKPRSFVDFNVKNDNELFLHIRGKGLFHYDNEYSKTTKVVEEYVNQEVLCNPEIEFQNTAFSDVFIQTLNKNKGYGGVKDIAPVNGKSYLAATSIGLVYKGDSMFFKKLKKEKIDNNNAFFITKIKERCFAVRYHQKSETIYVATQSKLLSIKKGVISEITFNNKPIIANSLVLEGDKLLIGSQQNGVLRYHNNTTTALYNKENGLVDNLVKKIALKDDYLFVLNPDFLEYINIKTQEIKPLNKAEGIIGYINAFHLSKNKLWVLTDNSTIMSMPLSQIQKMNTTLHFKVDSVQRNNELVSSSKKGYFTHNQNNITFDFHLKNDSYREQAQIKYRLDGFDETNNSVSAKTLKASYKKLPAGTYRFVAFAQYGTVKSDEFHYNFTIKPPFWKTWWFASLVALVVFAMAITFYKYKMLQHKIKTEEKLKQKQIQADLIDAKLTAIRTQMNPHFIFNSINSIQDLVLQNESLKTYDSLVLFSQLVRNTLEYSEKEFITLKEETDFITVYLSLEKLRFKNNFSFTVTTDGNENVLIPSLTIQPFIENAIKHGLLHSNKEKILSVHFEIKDELICTIIDNGIGRKASKKIAERKKTQHNSFSTGAIKKRLKILEEKLKKPCTLTITDLVDAHNLPKGTKVIVRLPILTEASRKMNRN